MRQPITPFFLSAFLDSLKAEGYTILLVRGALPPLPHPEAGSLGSPGSWLSPAEVQATTQFASQARQQGYLKAAYTVRLLRGADSGLRTQGLGVHILSAISSGGSRVLGSPN